VSKDVVYVLKGMIMCWEKDVICAQRNDNVLGKRRDMCSQ
jgi:hypothetical protein